MALHRQTKLTVEDIGQLLTFVAKSSSFQKKEAQKTHNKKETKKKKDVRKENISTVTL